LSCCGQYFQGQDTARIHGVRGELPQKESNRKGEMPQNKNLTQICLSERGFGRQNGVNNAGKEIAYTGNQQAVSKGREKRKDGHPQRTGQNDRV